MKQFVPFKDVKLGDIFYCNGNRCCKVSTRTALLCEYGRVFYFKQSETCTKG